VKVKNVRFVLIASYMVRNIKEGFNLRQEKRKTRTRVLVTPEGKKRGSHV